MPTIQSNGINLAYDVRGSGPALVLVTGVGYSQWFWSKLVPELTQRLLVVTFDNRGAGESDKPAGPYTVPMMADDTEGLLDALNLKGACIMGHSLGGFIAQELAITRPDLVSRLILASTNYGGQRVIPITPEAMKVLTDRSGDPIELVKRGIRIACAPDFEERHPEVVQELVNYRLTNPVPPAQYAAQVAAGAGMSVFSDETVDERMSKLTMPVLILFGEHDNVVPPGNAELMRDKIAGAQVKIIPGGGHMFPIECPVATAQAILQFMGN